MLGHATKETFQPSPGLSRMLDSLETHLSVMDRLLGEHPCAIAMWRDEKVVYCNPAFLAATGRSAKEVGSRSWKDFVAGECPEATDNERNNEWLRPDGRCVRFRWMGRPVDESNGHRYRLAIGEYEIVG